MPSELAIAARAAGSGGTSSGGIGAVPVAGVPTASMNLSKPAGVCTLRYKACGLVTTKRQLPGQKGDRSRCSGVRFATHLDAQFAVEHKEGLVIRQIPMHRTGIALLSLVFQDRQASGCGVPAGAHADRRAQERHRLLDLEREGRRGAHRIGVVLKRHILIVPVRDYHRTARDRQ